MGKLTLTAEMLGRSRLFDGNPYRLAKLFEKARRGEKITYVALGGSITQRYNASSAELCYAALIAKWLGNTFGNAETEYINAGIGATGSLIALHRLKRDVLAYKPDLVTVEFAVNEGSSDFITEVYDNLIANILNSGSKPAVVSICMVNSRGGSAQDSHEKVCRYYGVPLISYKNAVWQEIEAGRLSWSDVSDDLVHPNDAAHALTAQLVTDYFKSVLRLEPKDMAEHILSSPLINSDYKNAAMYYTGDITPLSIGCFTVDKVDLNKMPNGWVAYENGAPLIFEFENCRRIYILFERTNKGDGGRAEVLAGERRTVLDADFKDGWGVYSNHELVFKAESPERVRLEIKPTLEKGRHFAVAGIMVS